MKMINVLYFYHVEFLRHSRDIFRLELGFEKEGLLADHQVLVVKIE